jgi:hypothetical protein
MRYGHPCREIDVVKIEIGSWGFLFYDVNLTGVFG